MTLADADRIAARIVALLTLSCSRIEVAGSVRRRKAEVGDIEIVCIPRTRWEPTLFGPSTTERRDPMFASACRTLGILRKGEDPQTGKYVQLWVDPGVQVDLFTAVPENWGLIYAIRTGSARFSHEVLARGWCAAGYQSVGGFLHRRVRPDIIPVHEELHLFNLIGVPFCSPEDRA